MLAIHRSTAARSTSATLVVVHAGLTWRRRQESDAAVPPHELVDYEVWCADRGLAAWVDWSPAVAAAGVAVAAQGEEWWRQRRKWADEHGVDEVSDMDFLGPVPWEPWDPSKV
jgi:hypothetical protein